MLTNRERVLRELGLPMSAHPTFEELSKMTGVPMRVINTVYRRGYAAATTNPESVRIKGTFEKNPNMSRFPRAARLSNEQWGRARVYSFLSGHMGLGGGKTYFTADSDLARSL